MDNYQKRVVAAMRRGKWFLQKYVQLIGEAEVGPAITQLDEAITGIASDTTEKVESHKLSLSGTVSKYDLRRRLLDAMAPVSVLALSKLVGTPEVKLAKFDIPSPHAPDVVLIAGGRAMATAAAKYRELFVALGRPADFVEVILGAADDLENKIVERDGERINRRRAVLGIDVKLAKARTMLRYLSSIVVGNLRAHPDLVGAWRQAIRIGGHSAPVPEEQGTTDSATPPSEPTGPVLVKDGLKKAA